MSAAGDIGDAPFGSRRALLGALMVTAAILGVAVWIDVLPLLHPPPPEVQGKRILPVDPESVDSIDVVRGRKDFRLLREGSGWILLDHGQRSEVRDDRVDEFLATLADLVELMNIGPKGEVPVGDFGLADPRESVTLAWPDGRRIQILLGDRNPPLTGIYALVLPGEDVVLVGAVLLLEIDKLAALASAQPSNTPTHTR